MRKFELGLCGLNLKTLYVIVITLFYIYSNIKI